MPRRSRRAVALALAALAVLLSACQPPLPPLPEDGAPLVTEPPTTTAPPNAAPATLLPAMLRATVGEPLDAAVGASDPDGDPVSVSLGAGVPDLALAGAGGSAALAWTPATAGTWTVPVVLDDGRGGRTEQVVTLQARYEANPAVVVGMGDSVASGHGLQRRDYLGGDRCWRAEGETYPDRVLDRLEDSGRWPANGRVALVACSGVRAADLLTRPVGGGLAGTAPAGTSSLPQVEWAVRANPGLVTITVGANDIGFSQPWELVRDGALDAALLDTRLARLGADLRRVLDRLVAETDAVVVVTTYYDPSAASPQGIDGCRTACFRAVVESALDRFNATIAGAVADTADPRVRLADVRPAFVGHGAPNGLGPDGAREDDFGLLGAVVGPLTSGTHPYCARGDTTGEPWVNSLDCVHPDDRGTEEIARIVAAAAL